MNRQQEYTPEDTFMHSLLQPTMMVNHDVQSEALGRILLLRGQENDVEARPEEDDEKSSRKRVRFGITDEQNPKRVKTVIHPSMNVKMEEEESSSTWHPRGYFKQNLQNSKLVATTFALQSSTNSEVKTYSEALASTYASCTILADDDSSSVHADGAEILEHFAQHLALVSNIEHVSIHGESARGLEKVAVPVVGREALRRRNDVIAHVLLAQEAMSQSPSLFDKEKQDIIRRISEGQSMCARKFAKSMGTSDALSALMEYGLTAAITTNTEDERPEHNKKNLPPKVDGGNLCCKSNFNLFSLINAQNTSTTSR